MGGQLLIMQIVPLVWRGKSYCQTFCHHEFQDIKHKKNLIMSS